MPCIFLVKSWVLTHRQVWDSTPHLTRLLPPPEGGGLSRSFYIGAGCVRPEDTHIYLGTSGWVSTYLDYQTVDINAMITDVLSAKKGYYNYYAELETAGKCFEWAIGHLVSDEARL